MRAIPLPRTYNPRRPIDTRCDPRVRAIELAVRNSRTLRRHGVIASPLDILRTIQRYDSVPALA